MKLNPCHWCGAPIQKRSYESGKRYQGKKYCSRRCADESRKEKHPWRNKNRAEAEEAKLRKIYNSVDYKNISYDELLESLSKL